VRSYATSDPGVAQELAKRIAGGLAKIVRTFVPTRENLEKKREHLDVTFVGGVLHAWYDHTPGITLVRPKLVEMCKKKSPLRAGLEGLDFATTLNYGTLSPWLKLHEKTVQAATLGADGLSMVVAEGLVELSAPPSPAGLSRAAEAADLLGERVTEDRRLTDPLEFDVPESGEPFVLAVGASSVEAARWLAPDFGGLAQVRLRPGMLHGTKARVVVYAADGDDRIVSVETDTDLFASTQYFRVLKL
jgi:hypothetical protein